ncbi:MAG TPA: hypothetical protein VMP01_26940 [Pirellulaceae bacterium]|nr:hypothetical protein [Pirellulaceae bacterium]
MRISRRLIALVLVFLIPAAALACLWDSETLKQERSRFPSTLELITGKFLRHSPAFYEWRIKDRQEKLKTDPKNVGYYDDIAVSYEKIGQHDKAIETILAKEEIQPGLYETYSNLGTFYILAGDFEKGLPYIDKALAINPDAHFGREKYQKWLVEYAMTRMKDGKLVFPMSYKPDYSENAPPNSFAEFVASRLGKTQLNEDEAKSAITGVLGMMRFANHKNPLLLEALANLLTDCDRPEQDAKQLAARALLQASYVVEDPQAKAKYRALAKAALEMQTSHRVPELEAEFTKELADAEVWYAALEKQELDWIRQGGDVEARFDRLYSEEPTALTIPEPETLLERVIGSRRQGLNPIPLMAALVIVVGIVGTTMWWRWSHRKRSIAAKQL